jgi:hypothetical protein
VPSAIAAGCPLAAAALGGEALGAVTDAF